MKVIDSSFKELPDTNNNFGDIYKQVIDHLKTVINNEELLNQIITNCDHSVVQMTDGKTYTILANNGVFKTLPYNSSAGALKTNMAVSVKEKEVAMIPGVALRPTYDRHQFIHELFHVASTNQHNYFDDEGVAFTKTGTKIDYFNRDLTINNKTDNPSSDGLNEGITELLASQVINKFTGHYPTCVIVASLLTACNNKLLSAYFSNDIKELESFYKDLEEKQTIITREDLCKFDSSVSIDDEELTRFIVGAIKYNDAYGNTIDISQVSNYLDHFYMLDSGSWMDLISESINKYEDNNTVTPRSR